MTPLKAAMDRHGLTTADIALLTGSSERMIKYWKTGEWPAPKWLLIILAALDDGRIDIDWLIAKLKLKY
jgi:hypothetical protein